MRDLVLVLGGARSGKSDLGQRLASRGERVLFVATAEPGDAEMARKIRAHRRRRPKSWETLEESLDLPGALGRHASGYDTVLIDCVTVWVSNLLLQSPDAPARAARRVREAVEGLLAVYHSGTARWVLVSNEVGLGVVPPTPLGRSYREVLGWVNQALATEADEVYLVAAGLALEIKGLGARPVRDFNREALP